ncbi:MAG: PspA/IM30 family protein [Parcubacteria group bacterium]|nr:PspA/IM30 family protein [Parcubacteria group bacterium]
MSLFLQLAITAAVAIVATAIWIAVSRHRLARAIRDEVEQKVDQLKEAIRDPDEEIAKMEGDVKKQIAAAGNALIELETELGEARLEVANLKRQHDLWQIEAQFAASSENEDGATENIELRNAVAAQLAPHDQRVKLLEAAILDQRKAINELQAEEGNLTLERTTVRTRLQVAKTREEIAQVRAGVDLSGYRKRLGEINKRVTRREARAAAVDSVTAFMQKKEPPVPQPLGDARTEARALVARLAPKELVPPQPKTVEVEPKQ